MTPFDLNDLVKFFAESSTLIVSALVLGGFAVPTSVAVLRAFYYADKRGLPYERFTRPVFNVCVLLLLLTSFSAGMSSILMLAVGLGILVFRSIAAAG